MNKKEIIEQLTKDAFEKAGFNGTWLYAENGNIISKGAYGFTDAENKLPMKEDTIFEMASVKKMFTATAIMLLVRDNKLNLDDEYTKYFPEYPYKGVKIRHLLTHTSGMPDDFETENWVCPIWENEKRIAPCDEILKFIIDSNEEASHAPGETFRYTDIGYCLLANLVEKLSGIKFEDYLKKNIFEPAGMKESGIYHTRRDGRPSDRFARNMVLEKDGYVPSDLSEETAPYVVGSDGLNGCDYLYTTIFDMLAWDRALREEKVLTKEEQMIMFTPVKLLNGETFYDEPGEGYGFGWAVIQDDLHGLIVNHSGGMPGLETFFERFVDENKVLIIFNCRDFTDLRGFGSFWEGMRATARDEEPSPVTAIEDISVKNPDKSKWESFCGKYEHPENDEIIIDKIFIKNDELYANAIFYGEELTFRLYQIGENEFGRKLGMFTAKFGDDSIMFEDCICKKI